MLADRYDLPLSTTSAAARDAYVQGCDLALTFYPGAVEAYDRAIAADPGFALAHAGKAQVLMREGNVAAARAALAAAKDVAAGLAGARGQSHRVLRPGVRGPDRRRDRRLARASGGMAARRAGALHRREPERPDRRLRPHRAEAPDRGADGQPRPALRRRFLVPGPPCHGAVRGWAARGRPAEDRAIRGDEPEQRAWRAWLRACLLRERRAGHGPRLPLLLARHLSARRIFPWPSELASLAVRNPGRQLGGGVAAVSGRHRARPAQRRAATENVGRGGVLVALRTRRPSARRRRLARAVRLCEQRAAAAGQRARRPARHPGAGRHGR